MNLRSFLAFFCFLIPIIFGTKPMAQTTSELTADTIYIHANIYTGLVGESSSHAVQKAEAMAVRADKLIAVGSEADVMKLKGSQTKLVALQGHFVIPVLKDAHVHLTEAG